MRHGNFVLAYDSYCAFMAFIDTFIYKVTCHFRDKRLNFYYNIKSYLLIYIYIHI